MGSGNTGALLHALVVIGLACAIWLALAGPAYIAKLALEALGVLSFPRRGAELAGKFGAFGSAITGFFAHARDAIEANNDRQYVRVAVDESHKRLAAALGGTEAAMARAVADVRGLSGVSGPDTLLAKIHALEERTKLVDAISVEIDGEIEEKYAARAKARTALAFIIVFALAFATVNGGLLSQFFKSVIAVRIVGIPVSLLFSIVVVIVEMALGFLLTLSKGPVRWLLVSMIVVAALFEAVVLGIVSNGFDLDMPLIDTYPVLKLWMAPLGLMLVTATSVTGYWLHEKLDELAEYRAAGRLKRELDEANAFVRDLPGIWQGIAQKAREAEHDIQSYLKALGGHDGQIAGAIQKISAEHAGLGETLRGAQVDDWPALVAGSTGDQRRAAAQNIGLFLFTVLGGLMFASAVSLLAIGAIGGRLPAAAGVTFGAVVSLGFAATGHLAFQRLQLVEGSNGRAVALRSGPLEYVVAAIIVVGCATGIVWASVVVLGRWGALLGILLVACGGLLAFAGYGLERAARGGMLIATILAAFVVAVASALLGLLRYVLLWALAATAWLIAAIISLLAAPVALVVKAVRDSRHPTAAPADPAAQIAA